MLLVAFSTTQAATNVTYQQNINNYQPGGSKFMLSSDGTEAGKELAINWQAQAVRAIINLDGCTGNNENLLSIGNSIHQWHESAPYYNLHFYYTKSKSQLIIDLKDSSSDFEASDKNDGKFEKTLKDISGVLYIEINQDGLYINGQKNNDFDAAKLKDILALSNIQVGSMQGNVQSHATYQKVELTTVKTQLLAAEKCFNPNASDENQFYLPSEEKKNVSIDFNQQYIEAKLLLSTCTSTANNEHILSIGNAIDCWGAENQYNLHFWYTPSTKNLVVDFVDKDNNIYENGNYKKARSYTLNSDDLTIKLAGDGLYINGDKKDDFTSAMSNHLLKLTTINIGSVYVDNGKNISHATYKEVSVCQNIQQPSTEEPDGPGDPVVPTEKELTLDEWTDYDAQGTTKFHTTQDINLDTQVLKVSMDLTNCSPSVAENIFSIGNSQDAIANWGGPGWYAIHMYYTHSTKKLEVNYQNANTTDVNKATLTLNSTNLNIELQSKGLYINGALFKGLHNDNTEITYDANKLVNLLGFNSLTFGSMEGNNRSHAKYLSATVEENTNSDFNVRWISNQTKFEDHKEVAHATYIPYATTSDMKADAGFYATPWIQTQSSLVKNLNTVEGDEWKFCYVKGTTDGPGASEFYAKDFESSSEYKASDWKSIRVPLSWEMAGYGRPVYTNIGYPFVANAPKAMQSHSSTNETDNNATGFYRRTFTLDESWKDKRIFLHFDGVYSAAVVWVDGKYVGYSQGSNNDAEFDITAALDKASDGSNILTGTADENHHQLSVRVYRWCDGSYLEGQDAWHLSGIHRDVYLVAKPKVFVSDAVITSDLSADATSGKLNVALTIDNRDLAANVSKKLNVTLTDKDGKTMGPPQVVTYTSESHPSEKTTTLNVAFEDLSGLHPWTAETPYLYNIGVSQCDLHGSASNAAVSNAAINDAAGTEEMAFNTKYGFRQITSDTKLVYINGKRVFFKGVNTQDTHPEYGRAIDMETMMKDLTMMKRANINTVRTSHYPRQAKMYAMMDALGFYVMDEADLECHHYWINRSDHLTSNETWSAQYVDRNERMVKRDRNHPSVIFWSLGNESGDGVCMTNAYNAVKALDKERPVHYEGTFNRGYSNGLNTNTDQNSDLFSDMYPKVENVTGKMASNTYDKPYFICEYAHAMGQAVGNLKEYWDAIERSDAIIGGCIWDWVDQAIYQTESNSGVTSNQTDDHGFHYWTSGYDYNKTSGQGFQGNFLDNGLVTPDRRWSAKLTEVKKIYQYVNFSDFDASAKTVKIENKYAFTPISSNQFDIAFKVLKNGRLVEEGKVNSFNDIAPGATSATGSSSNASSTSNSTSAANITLPINTNVSEGDGNEYLVNVELRLKDGCEWAKDWGEAGYPVADAQFALSQQAVSNTVAGADGQLGADGQIALPTLPSYQAEAGKTFTVSTDAPATVETDTSTTVITSARQVSGIDKNGKAFIIGFDEQGKMTEWTYDGKSLLHTVDGSHTVASGAAPDFNSMRNTDNDIKCDIEQVNQSTSVEITTDLTESTESTLPDAESSTSETSKKATMSVKGTATNCTYTIDYTFYPDATVDMKVTFSPSAATRRLGLGMQFASGFEKVEYYARGPWSNYSDRKTGCYLGRYTTTVDDMIEEEIHPQTYGDHQDLRELILSNPASGIQLDVQVAGQVSFSLSHYNDTHWCDAGRKNLSLDNLHWWSPNLEKSKQVFAHFDYKQRGLGNNSCEGDDCLKDYLCPTTGSYTYTLRFKPSTLENSNF